MHLARLALDDSSLPPVSNLGQALFVEPRRVFASPLHSRLFKGIGSKQKYFVGISPECTLFIIAGLSVPFLFLPSLKEAVS